MPVLAHSYLHFNLVTEASVDTAAVAVSYTPAGKVTRSGTGLVMGGSPYRFIGFNMWRACIASWNHPGNYDGYEQNTGTNLADDYSGIHAAAPHVNAIRAWFFQQFALNDGSRDWSAIDKVLDVSDAAGVKVVAVLQDYWGYEYGLGHTGGVSSNPSAWYSATYSSGVTNETYEAIPYRDWVSEIVTRYAGDPRVLAWEPGNEMNGMTTSFASDITGLIRSADPDTPIGSGGVGTSGLYGYFDLCSYHYYDDYGQTAWAADASGAAAAGKCAYLGECGFSSSLGLQERADDFDALLAQVFATSNEAGFLAWQYPDKGDSFGIGDSDPMLPVLDSYHL